MSEAERELVALLAKVVERAIPYMERLHGISPDGAAKTALGIDLEAARKALALARSR